MPSKPEADARKASDNEQYDRAIILLSQAIELEPDNVYLFEQRGIAYFKNKQGQQAINDFNKAVELEPGYGYRYASRAYIKSKIGDAEGAVADYEKAVELDPEDAISYNNLGMAQEQLGYQQKAKRNLERADELSKIRNLQQPESGDKPNQNTDRWGVVIDVFRNRETRNEFLKFIRKGFKHD